MTAVAAVYIATTIKLLMDGNKNYDDLVPMSMAV